MRKFLHASTIVFIFTMSTFAWATGSGSAHSQPAEAVSVDNWPGFYAGLNAGWGWSHDAGGDISGDALPLGFQQCILASLCPGRIDTSYDGITAGAQAGYNWQQDTLVFGIEGDINYSDFSGDRMIPITQDAGATSFNLSQRINWFGTARVRLGITPADQTLLYATGGLAFGHVTSKFTVPTTTAPTLTGRDSEHLVGWTIGGGAEHQLSNDWSAKIEGLYYDLGDSRVTATNISPFFGTADTDYSGFIVRVGVNRKFN